MFLFDYHTKFKHMREVGTITTKCLDGLSHYIRPGKSTEDINQWVHAFQKEHEVQNSQHGYKLRSFSEKHKFPDYCCTSINEVMCHGLPSSEKLKEGDIVSVDVTFNKDGFHGDACRTYPVGKISKEAENLLIVAENALNIGIQQCSPGNQIGLIGKSIEKYVNNNNMWVVGDFVGHGIGQNFHEYPSIPHIFTEDAEAKTLLYIGQTCTIEPIIALNKTRYKVKKDHWTVVARDSPLTAQFECTLGITDTGVEVFCR